MGRRSRYISNSPWQSYFSEKDLKSVVSSQPKYTWYWNRVEGCGERYYGGTFAGHHYDQVLHRRPNPSRKAREPLEVMKKEQEKERLWEEDLASRPPSNDSW